MFVVHRAFTSLGKKKDREEGPLPEAMAGPSTRNRDRHHVGATLVDTYCDALCDE